MISCLFCFRSCLNFSCSHIIKINLDNIVKLFIILKKAHLQQFYYGTNQLISHAANCMILFSLHLLEYKFLQFRFIALNDWFLGSWPVIVLHRMIWRSQEHLTLDRIQTCNLLIQQPLDHSASFCRMHTKYFKQMLVGLPLWVTTR